MRYTGPKNKLARREGSDLSLKTPGTKSHSNLLKRLNIIPGLHQVKRRRRPTDFGLQLREKQKLKRIYGLSEKQLKNYFKKASRTLGNTADFLILYLERRLDNLVYRMGLAPTRAAARQLVNHGHVLVNQEKVTIPSFQVSKGDVISFANEKTVDIPYISRMLEKKDLIIPDWLERKGPAGKITGMPKRENIQEEVDLQLVVEFYSR